MSVAASAEKLDVGDVAAAEVTGSGAAGCARRVFEESVMAAVILSAGAGAETVAQMSAADNVAGSAAPAVATVDTREAAWSAVPDFAAEGPGD